MNYRKGRARQSQKSGRKNYCHKVLEGKNHRISAKRLTLPPGFLTNGYASNTVTRQRPREVAQTKRERVLKEDLHSFLQCDRKKLRRSERILKKQEFNGITGAYGDILESYSNKLDDRSSSTTSTKTSFQNVNNDNIDLVDTFPSNFNPVQSAIKNNSKSIFKEINTKYEQFKANEGERSPNLNVFSEFKVSPVHRLENVPSNRSFCEDLRQQVCVTLKRSSVKSECIANIFKEINCTNLALQGKYQVTDVYTCKDSPVIGVSNDEENLRDKYRGVPRQQWVFSTPPNQSLKLPPIEQCKLQAALMCDSGKRLYDINPNFNVNFHNMEFVPLDTHGANNGKQFPKTPANFNKYKRGGCSEHLVMPDYENTKKLWQDDFKVPRIIDERDNVNDAANYYNVISQPWKGMEKNFSTCKSLFQDVEEVEGNFTFIEDGEGYKIEESQKRHNNAFNTRTVFGENYNNFERSNLFDFSNMKTNNCKI